MDSSATKVLASLPSPGGPSPMGPSPMGPSPMGPSPMGLSLTGALPVGASPNGPFPLSPVNTIPHPLSPASNPDRTEGAPAPGAFRNTPGHASEGSHRLGPDLLQSGGAKGGSGSDSGVPWLGNTDQSVVYGGTGAGLSLPFKAASLQQLANAALTSKKVRWLLCGSRVAMNLSLPCTYVRHLKLNPDSAREDTSLPNADLLVAATLVALCGHCHNMRCVCCHCMRLSWRRLSHVSPQATTPEASSTAVCSITLHALRAMLPAASQHGTMPLLICFRLRPCSSW